MNKQVCSMRDLIRPHAVRDCTVNVMRSALFASAAFYKGEGKEDIGGVLEGIATLIDELDNGSFPLDVHSTTETISEIVDHWTK